LGRQERRGESGANGEAVNYILDAIDAASQQGAFFPAVVTALTVPDIAGAVDSPGTGSQTRYAAWVDSFLCPSVPNYTKHGIDGHALYALRCKLLHEGRSNPSSAPAAKKSAVGAKKRLLAFNIGPSISMHFYTASDSGGNSWTALRAEIFCSDMTSAARAWIQLRSTDPVAMKALQALVDVRTGVLGLPNNIPFICAEL
jgi:hypothetical protein